MKVLLICINILLASAIIWMASGIKGPTKPKYTVKRREVRTVVQAPVAQRVRKPVLPPEKMAEQNTKKIIETNIFDLERCPNAAPGAGNVRVQMTLVGICMVGDSQGAVIMQKQQNRNNNGFFLPPPPMPGNGRQMGFMPNNSNNNHNRRQNSARNNNQGGPGGPGGPPPMMMPGSPEMNMNQNKNQQTGSYKQYVRVGETLANGYKLVSVTREKAVLTRGNDRLELELQEASKNAPKTTAVQNRNSRTNSNTQMMNQMMRGFQQLQRMQGFQTMQMMRMMQDGPNSGRPNTGANSGRTRNNTRR